MSTEQVSATRWRCDNRGCGLTALVMGPSVPDGWLTLRVPNTSGRVFHEPECLNAWLRSLRAERYQDNVLYIHALDAQVMEGVLDGD